MQIFCIVLENKNASQNVFYKVTYLFVIKWLRENMFLVQDNIIEGYFRILRNGYFIFCFITDQMYFLLTLCYYAVLLWKKNLSLFIIYWPLSFSGFSAIFIVALVGFLTYIIRDNDKISMSRLFEKRITLSMG